jgi:Cysteine rich repeat
MNIRVVALGLALIGLPGVALAGGTAEQDAACRPDVRKFCHQIPPNAGDTEFLSCLQAHRPKLSTACRQMLESNGV